MTLISRRLEAPLPLRIAATTTVVSGTIGTSSHLLHATLRCGIVERDVDAATRSNDKSLASQTQACPERCPERDHAFVVYSWHRILPGAGCHPGFLLFKGGAAMIAHRSRGALLALAVAGCFVVGSAGAAEEPSVGTVVPEGEMTIFCQHAAEARFRADPDDVSTDPPVRREGKLLVLGTVDGDTHDFGFDCRFEENGAYLGLSERPSDE